jgi:hypothetical protein
MLLDVGGYTRRVLRQVVTGDTPVVLDTFGMSQKTAVFVLLTITGRRIDVEDRGICYRMVGGMSRHTADASDPFAGSAYPVMIVSIGAGDTPYFQCGNDGTGDLNECRIGVTSVAAETWDYTLVVEVFETHDLT